MSPGGLRHIGVGWQKEGSVARFHGCFVGKCSAKMPDKFRSGWVALESFCATFRHSIHHENQPIYPRFAPRGIARIRG